MCLNSDWVISYRERDVGRKYLSPLKSRKDLYLYVVQQVKGEDKSMKPQGTNETIETNANTSISSFLVLPSTLAM